jgi:hypothetical protein
VLIVTESRPMTYLASGRTESSANGLERKLIDGAKGEPESVAMPFDDLILAAELEFRASGSPMSA